MDISTLPWGKHDDRRGITHRLEHHCADVAACFQALVSEPVLRDRFDRAVGGAGLHATTTARLAVLAFLHDFGKVCSGFQFRVGEWRKGAPSPASHVASFFWACNRPEVVKGLGLAELATWGAGLDGLLRAALAHHGRPMSGHRTERPGPREAWQPFGGYDPVAEGRGVLRRAREWFPEAFSTGPELPTSPALAHLFAGAVAIADQIGSNEELFPYEATSDPNYIDRARSRATNAVRRFGFTRSDWVHRTDRTDFGDLFPTWSPRRVQTAVAEAPFDCPLLILESETGSGKTEAAIWRFAKLWQAGLVDGLYFALPTRAAAVQLHARVDEALRRMFPKEARLGTVLAVPGYVRAGQATGRLAGWDVIWADDPKDADRLARWSAEGVRKFLSATAAVGTVDQALLAGLRVKWAHFRGSALSRSLLVVDEVHASDAYMTEVLRAVLRGHLDVGGHALLMSATLGSAARDELASPWVGRQRNGTTMAGAKRIPYPVLTSCGRGLPARFDPFDSVDYKRTVRMTDLPVLKEPARVAELAITAARRGAKVLVIRNTVEAARTVFDEVCGRHAGGLLLQVAGGPAVHHGRFAAEDRKLLDVAVEEALGRGRKAGGRIVIGTQTLEQSLDIDADILITDLCPVDVLLQRIGRVHRHEGACRPEGFSHPHCKVLVPEGRLGSERLLRYGMGMSRTGGIYRDLRVLELTRRLVAHHPVWTIPEMNRELVEEGTHPEPVKALEDELGPDWAERAQDVQGKEAAERQTARLVTLDRSADFRELSFPPGDERVRTRLGEDGPRVRLSEGVIGPFGQEVTSFTIPAHMLRAPPSRDEIDGASAEPVHGGLVLVVGSHRFHYDRGGIRSAD